MFQKNSDNLNKNVLTQAEITMVSGGIVWVPVLIGAAAVVGLGCLGLRELGKGLGKGIAGHGTFAG